MSPEEIRIADGPSVALKRIEKIDTYEVLASDLEALDDTVSRENQSLGFMMGTGGVAIPTIVSFAVADNLSTRATAIYASVGSVALVAMLWFLVTWIRVRKRRPRLLSKIRGEVNQRPIGDAVRSRDHVDDPLKVD